MKHLLFKAAAVAAASLMVGGAAQAARIQGLYDTGVDSAGAVLSDNSLDMHYLVNGTVDPVVFSNGNYYVAPDARFIGEQAGGGYVVPVNTYTLSFSLDGLNSNTASFAGFFSADNYATVYLNGVEIAQDDQMNDSLNYGQETPFSATSDFLPGMNTLSFVVTDLGMPSGLEVSGLTGSASPISTAPEPSAWALMIAGLSVAGLALRRRRDAGTAAIV